MKLILIITSSLYMSRILVMASEVLKVSSMSNKAYMIQNIHQVEVEVPLSKKTSTLVQIDFMIEQYI